MSLMTYKRVEELREGDKIDLEGDAYADPDKTEIYYQCEYVEVIDIKWEGENCVVISTEAGVVGFPPKHEVKVVVPEDTVYNNID